MDSFQSAGSDVMWVWSTAPEMRPHQRRKPSCFVRREAGTRGPQDHGPLGIGPDREEPAAYLPERMECQQSGWITGVACSTKRCWPASMGDRNDSSRTQNCCTEGGIVRWDRDRASYGSCSTKRSGHVEW